MTKFKVFDSNWENEHHCETLREARAYRYQEYGYAGYIIEYNDDGEEIAQHA